MLKNKVYAVWDNKNKTIIRSGKRMFYHTTAPAMTIVNQLNSRAGELRYSLGTFGLNLEELRQTNLPRPS